MASKFVNLTDTLEQWRVKANAVYGMVGDLTTLNKSASVSYSGINGINADDFTGTAAEFVVTRGSGSYTATITDGGSGYQVGDTILVEGTLLGGESPTHDATITVTSVDPAFAIDGVSLTGTAQGDLISEINGLRSETGVSTLSLTTNSTTVKDAVNEIESVLRGTGEANYTLDTDAVNVIDGINELEAAVRGTAPDYSLDTTATDLVAAINEHEGDIGTMSFDAQGTSPNADSDHTITYVDLGTTITSGLNNLKDKTDLIADELGGIMSSDYDGPETNHMDALNALYNSSSLGTLDNTYVRRDGSLTMTGLFQIHTDGITSNGDNLLLKTGASDVTAVTISASNQNVGIGGGPGTQKLKVTGGVNATTGFYYNGDDTDTRYIRADVGSAQNLDIDTTVRSNITLAPGSTKSVIIGGSTVATDSLTFLEWFQDTTGTMFTGNTETGGISAVYDDSTGKITLAIANNSHTHVHTNITDWTEAVQDTVGAMLSGNTESGLTVDYDDNSGKLNLNVNDPVITISGEASGSATMTNLGNTNISVTLDHEAIQDAVSELITGNTETGITVDYDDTANKINFALTADPTITLAGDVTGSVTLTNLATQTYTLTATVQDDSHNHVVANIDGIYEYVQDTVKDLVDNPNGTEAGISVTYDDANNRLNFDVNDFTLTFDGDVTGNGTISNLASNTITISVNNDSHTHDGRYYTESESDSRFVNTAGDTMTGNLTIQDSNLYVQRDAYIGENGAGDSNLYFYDDNSDAWRRFWWDNGNNEFRVQDNGGTTRTLLHSGNAASFTVTNATNATNATNSDFTYVTRDDSTNTTYYPIFAPIGSGQQRMRNDAGMSYNPSNNTLSTGTFSGTATQATYADLAENYLADAEYPIGTVMAIGGDAEVTAADTNNAHSVIGVVSENPAYLMNKDLENGTAIALKGRVKVRVRGEIRKGDRLVPSETSGEAEANNSFGVFSFAIAMENNNPSGIIEAVIL